MKKLATLLLMILSWECVHNTEAGYYGFVSSDIFYDNNVYKDFTNLSDFGAQSDILLGYSSSISAGTFASIRYSLSSLFFPVENLYNRNFHKIRGSVRRYASGLLDYGVDAGLLIYDYPNLKILTSDAPYLNPFLKLYLFGETRAELGLEYTMFRFPNYDLDSNNNEIYINCYTPLFYGVNAELDLAGEIFNYTERRQYSISSNNTRIDTGILREDELKSAAIKFDKYAAGIGELKISYASVVYNSNANEFYAASLLSGQLDTRLLANFRSYDLNRIDASLKSGSQEFICLNVYATYYSQKFAGWPARDTNGIIRKPQESRDDNFYEIIMRPEREIMKNFFISLFVGYQVNDSNDLIYNYTSLSTGVGASYKF